jgi:hypothetical protein
MSEMLAQALQGGGAGPPGALGGGAGPPPPPPPPGALGALGGGPPPQDLDAGPLPGQGDQGAGGGDFTDLFQNSIEALDVAEAALHAFIQMDPDHADRAAASQALTSVLKLKAGNQQSAQAGDAKSLQRALSGAPGLAGLGG